MSDLAKRKSRLQIVTCDGVRERGKYREVVIECHPRTATVRLKGMRTAFEIEWAAIYHLAAKMQAESVRREKREAKKLRRAA